MLAGLIALTISALFCGAAIYVSVAEHPARLTLDDDAAWRQWGPSYARGYAMQASLAIVAGIAGIAAWWTAGDALSLIGAALILANWPYTLVVIMPVNHRLQAMTPPLPAEVRSLLVRWGHLHAGRSVLGALATLAFFVAACR